MRRLFPLGIESVIEASHKIGMLGKKGICVSILGVSLDERENKKKVLYREQRKIWGSILCNGKEFRSIIAHT